MQIKREANIKITPIVFIRSLIVLNEFVRLATG